MGIVQLCLKARVGERCDYFFAHSLGNIAFHFWNMFRVNFWTYPLQLVGLTTHLVQEGAWTSGNRFYNTLKGTGHTGWFWLDLQTRNVSRFSKQNKMLFEKVQFNLWKRIDMCWKCYITGRPDYILLNHYGFTCQIYKDFAKIYV